MHAREPRVEDGDAGFDAPKTGCVEGPAPDLNLGSNDTVLVFVRVGGESGALLVGHVAVGQALGLGHDKNHGNQVDYEEYLSQISRD